MHTIRRPSRALAAVLALLALVALSACGGDDGDDATDDTSAQEPDDADTTGTDDTDDDGGDDDDSSEAALPDPCTLLEQADLQSAFGSPFDAGELTDQEQTGSRQCVWTNTDAPPVKTFSLVVSNEASVQKAFSLSLQEYFDSVRDASTVDEELAIGVEAYRTATTVNVLEDGIYFSFSTFLGDSSEAIAGLKTLATKVIEEY